MTPALSAYLKALKSRRRHSGSSTNLVRPTSAEPRVLNAGGSRVTFCSREPNKSPRKQPYMTQMPKHSAKMAASTTQADFSPAAAQTHVGAESNDQWHV